MYIVLFLLLICTASVQSWNWQTDTWYALSYPLTVNQTLTIGVHPHGKTDFGIDYEGEDGVVMFHMHCYYDVNEDFHDVVLADRGIQKMNVSSIYRTVYVKDLYPNEENVFSIKYEKANQIHASINGYQFTWFVNLLPGKDIIGFNTVMSPNITFLHHDS
ncbi:unnamed protein product [Bursaphelenchus okinawaensis]|uniref:Galectin n=1 Tax=Bursaphelenchus okinawaensis TaxID=465554 RepID=A0A811JQ76_9BILA|nr:unnamed protein product [Bursaphelenchus okinawaensis]CAG9077659.1 unnamed protein product [Bursaphelenchus okinawaensis]